MKIKIKSTITPQEYQNPFELYLKLSENGNAISLLFESKSPNQKYPRKSMIVPNPAIKIIGKKEEFKIEALNNAGKEILKFFNKNYFKYAQNYAQKETKITGKVKKKENPELNEEKSAKLASISFVIKTILNKFESKNPYAGLYGVFAYDFARNFYKIEEKLPDE